MPIPPNLHRPVAQPDQANQVRQVGNQPQGDQPAASPRSNDVSHQALAQPGASASMSAIHELGDTPTPRLSQMIDHHALDQLAVPTHKLVELANSHFVTMQTTANVQSHDQADRSDHLQNLPLDTPEPVLKEHIYSVLQHLVDNNSVHDLTELCGAEGCYTKNLLDHLNSCHDPVTGRFSTQKAKGLIELINLTKEYAVALDNPSCTAATKETALLQFPPKAAHDYLCIDGSKETINDVMRKMNTDTQHNEILFGAKESLFDMAERSLVKHITAKGWLKQTYGPNHKHLPSGAWTELGVSKPLINEISQYIIGSTLNISASQIHELGRDLGNDVTQLIGEYLESPTFKANLSSLDQCLADYVSALNDAFETYNYAPVEAATTKLAQHPLGANFIKAGEVDLASFAVETGPDEAPYEMNYASIKANVIDQVKQIFELEAKFQTTSFESLSTQPLTNLDIAEDIFSNNDTKQYNALNLMAQLGRGPNISGSDRVLFMQKVRDILSANPDDNSPPLLIDFKDIVLKSVASKPQSHLNLATEISNHLEQIFANPSLRAGIIKKLSNSGEPLNRKELTVLLQHTQTPEVIESILQVTAHRDLFLKIIGDQGQDHKDILMNKNINQVLKTLLQQMPAVTPWNEHFALLINNNITDNLPLLLAAHETNHPVCKISLENMNSYTASKVVINFVSYGQFEAVDVILDADIFKEGFNFFILDIARLENSTSTPESKQKLDMIYAKLKINNFHNLARALDTYDQGLIHAAISATSRTIDKQQAADFIKSPAFVKLLRLPNTPNKAYLVEQLMAAKGTSSPAEIDFFKGLVAEFICNDNYEMSQIFVKYYPDWHQSHSAQATFAHTVEQNNFIKVVELMSAGFNPLQQTATKADIGLQSLIHSVKSQANLLNGQQLAKKSLRQAMQTATQTNLVVDATSKKAVMKLAVDINDLALMGEAYVFGADIPSLSSKQAPQKEFKTQVSQRQARIQADLRHIAKCPKGKQPFLLDQLTMRISEEQSAMPEASSEIDFAILQRMSEGKFSESVNIFTRTADKAVKLLAPQLAVKIKTFDPAGGI